MMLIDKYLPIYHFAEKHSIHVEADSETIFKLVDTLDLSSSRIIRILFWLRGMSRTQDRQGLKREGFIELERLANDEIVIGLIGQFWRASGNLQKFAPREFVGFDRPNFLKGAWNFKIVPEAQGNKVMTETRVYCTDEASRKKFSWYWFVVKPFSGLIRMEMLRAIKRSAEQNIKIQSVTK